MHKYKLSYTIYDEKKPGEVTHEDYEFETDSDLMGAADEGMCTIFDKYATDKPTDVLFRSIELLNPKDAYKIIVQQARERNARNSP